MKFLIKDSSGLFDLIYLFSYIGSNRMVLEPTVGMFYFSFSLRGKGMGDF